MTQPTREEALAHFGVKGMRWGVRNEPGAGGRVGANAKTRTTTGGSKMSKMDVLLAEGRGEMVVSKLSSWAPSLATTGAGLPVSLAVWGASKVTFNTLDGGTARVLVNRGNRFLHGEKLSYKRDSSLAKKNMSSDDIMKKVVPGVNPDYPKIGTNTNCRRCTMTYEMRRRGYDVKATKTIDATGQAGTSLKKAVGVKANYRTLGENNILKSAHPIKDKFIRDKNLTTKTAPDAIFKALKDQPERSRGEIGMMWEMGGGHSIAYEIIKGKPVLFDTQSGKQFTNSSQFASYYKTKANQVSYTRLDNKKVNKDWVERWIKNND